MAFPEASYPIPSWPRQVPAQPVVQVARDAAALLILQRHETDGKAPQFTRASIDHFFQLNRVVTNRLLQQFAVVNVRAGAVPLNNFSLRISNRYRSRPEPAIGAVFGTQTIFRFETSSRSHRLYPNLCTALDVVRVHVIQPINAVPIDC